MALANPPADDIPSSIDDNMEPLLLISQIGKTLGSMAIRYLSDNLRCSQWRKGRLWDNLLCSVFSTTYEAKRQQRVKIGSGNGLLLIRHQTIIWTNVDVLSIRPLKRNYNEI